MTSWECLYRFLGALGARELDGSPGGPGAFLSLSSPAVNSDYCSGADPPSYLEQRILRPFPFRDSSPSCSGQGAGLAFGPALSPTRAAGSVRGLACESARDLDSKQP